MITPLNIMGAAIADLMNILQSLGIDPKVYAHLEHDYLIANKYIEDQANGRQADLNGEGRAALCGLYDLVQWIWSVQHSPDFKKLIPHLEMLSESATRINSFTPMINPAAARSEDPKIARQQDDKTNKLIETIIGMFAIKVGTDVDLDDPVNSSKGLNPDIIFTYEGVRVAIACKTLRGKSKESIIDNLKSACTQLKRAECDRGYIALNAMNVLPHELIGETCFANPFDALQVLTQNMVDQYNSLVEVAGEELKDIFDDLKISPVIVTFVHSTTRVHSPAGMMPTILKSTFATELQQENVKAEDYELLNKINLFIHNRL